MLAGKCLIAFSLLWPIPFGFIMYPLFGYKINMPMWGVERGYWWPLLAILGIGVLLCLVSRYKASSAERIKNIRLKETLLWLTFEIQKRGIALIVAFFLVTILIIALHRLFFTSWITVSVPVCAAIGIVGFLLFVGWRYYNDHKDD